MHDVLRKALSLNLKNEENFSLTFDELRQDILDCESFDEKTSSNAEKLLFERSEPQVTLMRLGIYTLTSLSLAIRERVKQNQPILWPSIEDKEIKPNPYLVLDSLTINLLNHSTSILHLLRRGYDLQAKVVLRAFTELADCLQAITYDLETYEKYVSEPDDINKFYRHWKEHFTPPKIGKIVDKGLRQANWSKQEVDWFTDFKKSSYSFLSNFSHVSYASYFVMAYGEFGLTKIEKLPSSLYGSYSISMNATLNHYLIHLLGLLAGVKSALDDKHQWEKEKNSISDRFGLLTQVYITAVFLSKSSIFTKNEGD